MNVALSRMTLLILVSLQLGTGCRVPMCTISTALMASARGRSVSSLLLVSDLPCCLAPLLDLLPTNSQRISSSSSSSPFYYTIGSSSDL